MRRPWNRGAAFTTLLVLASLVELSMVVGYSFRDASPETCVTPPPGPPGRGAHHHMGHHDPYVFVTHSRFRLSGATRSVRSSLTHTCFRQRALLPDRGSLSQLPGLFAPIGTYRRLPRRRSRLPLAQFSGMINFCLAKHLSSPSLPSPAHPRFSAARRCIAARLRRRDFDVSQVKP